jgi:gliding motility-associated-like protein
LNVSTKPKPFVYIGNDTSICINKQVVLTANSGAIGRTYLWNTGEITPSITVNKTGTYAVTVTENLCTATDTAVVFPGDCELFIPNAFSPNKDGINDYFGVINSVYVQEFAIKIFNRYGQVVFSANNITDKWDGTYKGKVVSGGAYTWSIVYINAKGFTKWLKGSVLILP